MLRAQQQQQAASDIEPGWDKLSSDDFETWMDNGGPANAPPGKAFVASKHHCLPTW